MSEEPQGDTPESDEFYCNPPENEPAFEFARKLERERDEARRLLAEINRSQSTGVECHRCAGKLEPDQTCANFYCPNFTFKWPNKPI
jgi:hypothetical protein